VDQYISLPADVVTRAWEPLFQASHAGQEFSAPTSQIMLPCAGSRPLGSRRGRL